LKERNYKIIGSLIILIGLVLNPFVVEQLFSPDQKLDFLSKYITIAIFDILLLIIGLMLIKENTRKIIKNKTIKKIFLTIITVTVVVAIIEMSFYFLNFHKQNTKYVGKYLSFDKDLGYRGITNIKVNQIKYNNNKMIFNVTYILDEFGRRKNEHKPEASPLILFGGSYTFGHGLENNDTLSHYLTNLTNYDVYNYGLNAYGTQHMLAHLEREEFPKEINKTGGIAIYIFIRLHIRRVIGDMYSLNKWCYSCPYYYLDKNNELQRKGSFKTGRPIITKIYQILGKSNFVKYFEINLPPHKEKHVYLIYKIIEKSKELYEEKFNGTFYVLRHPLYNNNKESEELKKLLEENHIQVLEYNINTTNNYKEYKIPEDNHPNAKLNKLLAEKIAQDINK